MQRRGRNNKRNKQKNTQIGDFDRKVVSVRRVAKVGSGSKRLRFSSLVVAGDKKGNVGVGLGRGADTRASIEKGYKRAVASAVKVELLGDTIPHEVVTKFRAAKVLIKPAGPGTGIIASAPVRAVLELAGVRNVLTKQLGSPNEVTNTYAVLEAMKSLCGGRIIARRRVEKGKSGKKGTKAIKKVNK